MNNLSSIASAVPTLPETDDLLRRCSPDGRICLETVWGELAGFEQALAECRSVREPFRDYLPRKLEFLLAVYERLSPEQQWPFLSHIREVFAAHRQAGLLDGAAFSPSDKESLRMLLDSPVRFYKQNCRLYACRPGPDALPKAEVLRSCRLAAPDLTILIPVYNGVAYLAPCLESAQHQTLDNLEILCIDDGSDDATLELLLRYADADERFTILHQTNQGQATARNAGIALARGRYLQFLDSDDRLDPDAAKWLVTTADEKNLDVLYFDGESVFVSDRMEKDFPDFRGSYRYDWEPDGVISGLNYTLRALEDGKFKDSSCMSLYRKAYLDDYHIRFPDGLLHEDVSFSFFCAVRAPRVWHTRHAFYLRTVRPSSTMSTEKTFFHLYGYLSTLRMLLSCSSDGYDEQLDRALALKIKNVAMLCRNTYLHIPPKVLHLDRLTHTERALLDTVIAKALVTRSLSYRIGRLLTWPFRKLRRLFAPSR